MNFDVNKLIEDLTKYNAESVESKIFITKGKENYVITVKLEKGGVVNADE